MAYSSLGLAAEVGEVCGKLAKLVRDKKFSLEHLSDYLTDVQREELAMELGDVLWLLNEVAVSLGLSLESIAKANLLKLEGRQERNSIRGSGDNR